MTNNKYKISNTVRRFMRPALLGLFAFILALQLFALTQHRHDLADHHDDCPSCELSLHFSGGTLTPAPIMPLLVLALVFFVTIFPVQKHDVATLAYYSPPSQAPPF